jgi:hypothetical protein
MHCAWFLVRNEGALNVETVGLVTSIVVVGAAVAGAAILLINVPDIARYFRIKKM